MDQLAVKKENVKVLSVKLAHAEQQINTLLFEKAVMKIFGADVNALLSDIIEIRDSLITITVKSICLKNLGLCLRCSIGLKVFRS